MAKETLTLKIRKNTLSTRHKLAKIIAPRLIETLSKTTEDNPENTRPMISFLHEDYFGNKPLIGCEIGTREGINALRIIETLNIKKLYLIDPYTPYYDPLVPESSTIAYHEKTFSQAQQLLSKHASKIIWLKLTSDEAAYHIKDQLDFCYIDGDHSYQQVKKDITNYSELLTKDGVIGGHDFTKEYLGTMKAVLEQPNWQNVKSSVHDWWLIK